MMKQRREKKIPHFKSLREAIQFYLINCETVTGKLTDMFIILLNFLIVAILVVETYPVSSFTKSVLWTVELIVVAFFIIEYFVRLYGARNRLKHLVNVYSLIDLIAILPTLSLVILPLFGFSINIGFIRLIRVFRVFRIFRFLRFTETPNFFFGSIRMHLLKVVRLLVTILLIFFISSGLFYYVENSVNPGIQTFGDAFYFTVVTLATVGFGDITPQSEAGRWVTLLMIISGIILIPWQASQIIKEWWYISSKKEVVCPKCGLMYHDKDASHCKSCGQVIYQKYEG